MNKIFRKMQSAVNSKVFPGAVLLVSHRNEIVFHEAFGLADIESGQLMTKYSIFDLASLTKPLATALCVMKLVERGLINVDQKLSEFQINRQISNFARSNIDAVAENYSVSQNSQAIKHLFLKDKTDITIDHLLRHTSGLPAHRPFYEQLIFSPESERKNRLRQLVLNEPLVAKPGLTQIYSDLGYILLAWVVESVAGSSLDKFARDHIYQPLGISELFFMPISHGNQTGFKNYSNHISNQMAQQTIDLKRRRLFVSTEMCPWRKKILRAEVHDDNAWVVGGVEGHAGLFGSASGVGHILVEIMNIIHGRQSPLVTEDILKSFLKKKGEFDMVAGFDTPSLSGSSSGRYFSSKSIGHLGFTGTSFWIDPVKSLIIVLLSNRVHPTRNNQKIKELRPDIHDLVVETIFREYS